MTTTANDTVHIYFVLDRSGSMEAIRSDIVGGFNSFLADQATQAGACRAIDGVRWCTGGALPRVLRRGPTILSADRVRGAADLLDKRMPAVITGDR